MPKDYLCKDCKFNNNGWCTERKIQRLKYITECEYRNNEAKLDGDELLKDTQLNNPKHKQFGKREMFYNIQRQILGIDKDETVGDKFYVFKQIMVNLERMLQIEEGIHGVALDYLIDEDILKNSKEISNKWLNEFGEYKNK